jgi:hypothetical protein
MKQGASNPFFFNKPDQLPNVQFNFHLKAQSVRDSNYEPGLAHRVHKSMSLVSILSELNPVHSRVPYLFKIHFILVLFSVYQAISSVQVFSNKIYCFIVFPKRVACHTLLILLDLITLTISDGDLYHMVCNTAV